ncbi:hypothetical protein [Enterococcus mundtii]|uniref:hypothetical protein n=1 Tax=Enterococcus mundtii TaxID=53346 RepID=UPI0013764F26|nr:hypothetical protein [Enterococcus mundtii]NBA63199.1 hypothetical protein [Enterococcus mundtii]
MIEQENRNFLEMQGEYHQINNSHFVICEDVQIAFKMALKYGKSIRKKIIREKKSKKIGFWELSLRDGLNFIFCTQDYYEEYKCTL